jgi:two-component system CheB/CheR fusion protein
MLQPPHAFPVVGIGASAGGLEALKGFFNGLDPEAGIGIVIVTHLSPERDSMLNQILENYTELAVQVAIDGTEVARNCVYVLSADAILSIENRCLRIEKRERAARVPKPIDVFFSALAKDLGEYAVGIVLSGGDSDGTLGIRAIKERGGLTMAQVEGDFGPRIPDMPSSAISTGMVDFALPVAEMGKVLAEYAQSLDLPPGVTLSGPAGARQKNEFIEALPSIYAILRSQVGHDFGGYKTNTFIRRVQRRMQIQRVTTAAEYLERLNQDQSEVKALFRDLLINVTNFFRDADAFAKLAELAIPKLFEGRSAEETVRVWVPGCATGEEVYSLAILLREHMSTLDMPPRVQIFATDIDERALAVARAGRYPEALLDNISAERRERFFVADAGAFVLSKEIRELCIFSPHSVIRDPPFSRIDLISCRNLLIYFGLDMQNQVVPIFHYALRRGGYLFLGTSENVSQFGELFSAVDKKQRIFQQRDGVATRLRFPVMPKLLGQVSQGAARSRQMVGGLAFRHAVEAQVLERHAPPHIVVNGDGDVVYYSARIGRYLEPAPGSPTRHMMAMARKSLRLDLRTAFQEAVQSGRIVTRQNLPVEADDGSVQLITLSVDPIGDRGSGEPLFLVVFVDEGPPLSREDALNRARPSYEEATSHLERELRESRERLQSLIEEYETALEELKASNEELVSVNEELQSSNEELEASKEELQSLNEELQTVNAELGGKVEALDHANSDLQNLFASTDLATVFLDRHLAIRSFTPAVTRIFSILPRDRGRPITDFSSPLNLEGLAEDIATVMGSGRGIERRVQQSDALTHYLVRIAPYRDIEQQVEGVVITFVDVTSVTQAEGRQRLLVAELQHRGRNLIGIIRAIASQTMTVSTDTNDFITRFNGRLAALSRVQALLSRSELQPVSIATLVTSELEALGADLTSPRIRIEGPETPLRNSMVQILSLAIHELATNALKYGSLGVAEGTLAVTWSVTAEDSEQRLMLQWDEHGVAMPAKSLGPVPSGYGRMLIEKALPYQLGARTLLEMGGDGVHCVIDLLLAAQDDHED